MMIDCAATLVEFGEHVEERLALPQGLTGIKG